MTKKSVSKKFRFPRGIRQVNIPSLPPFGWDDEARKILGRFLNKYDGFPKNAQARLEYRFNGLSGIVDIQIYKYE